jgi:multiple sugar transport system permease protein
VVISAGLQSIDPDIYDAAEVDGATGLRRHWHITTPLLRPVLATVFLLSMLGAVAVFDLVLTLTNGGPSFASDVMGTYVFRNAFGQGIGSSTKLGYAAAAGLLMSLMILGLTAIYLTMRGAAARRRGAGA